MVVLLAGSSSAQTLVLGDDFESGFLLKGGAPPGVWTELGSNEASNTLMISAAAAHRGAAGMRLTDVTPGPGSGMITWLGGDVPQRAGSIHLRTWILLTGMTPTQLNSIMIHGNGMGSTLSELRLDSGASPGLGGTDRAGGYSFVNAPAGRFALGTWHLVEVAALGVGTATGRRQLWLDGTLLLAQDNIDWSGLSSTSVLIGQGWGDHSWTGQISFDDIRITDGPPATTLSSRVRSGAAVAGSCTPMTAELLAAAGSPAAAPYSFVAVLTDTSGGIFYASADCMGSPMGGVAFASGTSAQTYFWVPGAAGTATVDTTFIDFLSAPAQIGVATAPDLPNPAFRRPLALDVGWGCGVSPSSTALPLLLLVAAWFKGRLRRS